MKIKHQAPHLDKLKHLDVDDRKAIKSYNNTRKRKIRNLNKNKD
jgi:hypothetical protein